MSKVRRILGRARRFARRCGREPILWWRAFLRGVPGRSGRWMRNSFYGFQSGQGSCVLEHVMIYHPHNLRMGRNSKITAHCQLNARGGIEIGDDVLVGPQAMIWSQNHRYQLRERRINKQGYDRKKVVIESDVWIAAGAIILPGVRLKQGTVVAAGAVVTRSTEPYSVVAGVPAVPVGRRGECASISGDTFTTRPAAELPAAPDRSELYPSE